MKRGFLWTAVPLLLLAATMLVVGVGASALWFALIAVAIALVIVAR